MISTPTLDEVLCEDSDVALYRAHMHDGRAVLAKTLKAERPSTAEYETLRREAEAAKAAGTDVAAQPEHVMTLDGRPTLLLRDDGGISLAQLLGSPLGLARFFPIALALVEAVEKLHERHLVHGDLHPTDILVLDDERVELLGFGQTDSSITPSRTKRPASAWPYLSPEQARQLALSVDQRSDLYSTGVLFFEMIAGRRPFEAKDIFGWSHAHGALVPPPVSTFVRDVPSMLERIVAKLLAKPPESRYQSASGLRRDLERCFASWRKTGTIDEFALGLEDAPPRLRLVERVYGRREQIRLIHTVLERVRTKSRVETVLVSGPVGIGKTSVVREALRQATTSGACGTFAFGACQPANATIPAAPLLEALDGTLRAALESSSESPETMLAKFQEALGVNLPLLATLLPSLARMVGSRAPSDDVPVPKSKERFFLALDQLIGVFSTPKRPVMLVLDDLQWADATTLETLVHWATARQSAPLLVIGVYRSTDVAPEPPLTRAIARMREARASVTAIRIEPLTNDALSSWIADTLRVPRADAEPLAKHVSDRTGNNPLFVARFLESLRTENRLRWDAEARKWDWDVEALRAEPYTDDVAELIAANINALSPPTQRALGSFAAYGTNADLATLAMILECSENEALERLCEAFEARLIARTDGRVRFLHDRIQQTAYERLGDKRGVVHLQVARALLSRMPEDQLEERAFELVCQFELASSFLDDPEERVRIAQLELRAGQRAQRATHFRSAAHFLSKGVQLLSEEHWETQHDLAYALHYALARSRFVIGELASARQLGRTMLARARTGGEEASVHALLAEVELVRGSFEEGATECLTGLRALGIDLPAHPTDEAAVAATSSVIERLLAMGPSNIVDLPATTDPELRATCDLISSLIAPAIMVDWNLVWLAAAVAVERSLAHGNARSSPIAYATLGVHLAKDGRYTDAFRIGQAAYALASREENASQLPRASVVFVALLSYVSMPIRSCLELLRKDFEIARAVGDQSFACYLARHEVHFRFFAGDPLPDLDAAAQEAERFADRAEYSVVRDQIDSMGRLFQQLRGLPGGGSRLDVALEGSVPTLARFHYIEHDVVARFVLGDYEGAVAAAEHGEALADAVLSFLEVPELHFYAALSRAAIAQGKRLEPQLVALRRHRDFLQGLAAQAPSNFGARAALVSAEIARLMGDDLAAEHGYELAIGAARAAGQIHIEAFANEIAARFHRVRRVHTVAHAYFAQAHACYEAWGAADKAAALAREFPHITKPRVSNEDLASIIKAQQAISSTLRLPELHARLVEIAVGHARARRGCLLKVGPDQSVCVACTSGEGGEAFGEVDTPADPNRIPLALCRGVMRLKKPVVIADAAIENRCAFDPYFDKARIRSAVCIPIVREDRVMALLYLENDVAPGTFSPDRLAVLDCIAAQAAVSLENADLYSKLERENYERCQAEADLAKKTKLFDAILDATPLLVFIKDREGRYVLMNRMFEQAFHLDRAEFLGKTDYDLFPSESAAQLQERDRSTLLENRANEWDEVVALDDGLHSYLSIKFPLCDDDDKPWAVCGISADVTARKRADEELRQSLSLVEATLESTADGILVIDNAGKIVRYNRRFASMWQLPEELLLTGNERKSIDYVLDQLVDPNAFRSTIEGVYAGVETETSDTLRFKDGRVFERYSIPQRVADRIVGRVWSFRDVTQIERAAEERIRLLAEERRARAEAEEAVQLRDEFLSIASHELRTPLASLSLAVESLSTFLVEPINAERVRRSANIARRQVQRIVSLVDMLLDISRIRSGKLVLSPARVDLRNVINDVASLLATELSRAGSELVVHAPEPLIGFWDPLRLEQIVTNLLTNAIKFGRGKPITVDAVRQGDQARLSVADHGIGMPADRRSRIFEPFTRLVSPRHYGGLGLGLHITRTIVEAHGGTIAVESEEGSGSKFIVTLPLAKEDAS